MEYRFYAGEYNSEKIPHRQNDRCFPFSVIVYTESGEYRCTINGSAYTALRGELIIVPPYVYHSVEMTENGVISFAHISVANNKKDLLLCYQTPTILSGEKALFIRENIRRLVSSGQISDSIRRELLTDRSIADIYDAIISCSEPIVSRGKYDPIIERIHDLISAYPDKKYTLETLAQEAHLSVSTFSACFREKYGKSPIEFVIDRKIKQSIFLLNEGKSIKEVAYLLGFCDEYYFSRQFKKRLGYPPKKYAVTHR